MTDEVAAELEMWRRKTRSPFTWLHSALQVSRQGTSSLAASMASPASVWWVWFSVGGWGKAAWPSLGEWHKNGLWNTLSDACTCCS